MNSKLPLIEKGYGSPYHFKKKTNEPSYLIFLLYSGGIFLFFLVAIIRLFHLTIVKGAYYTLLSDTNRTRQIIIEAPRGRIVDRKGILLATSTEKNPIDSLERVTALRTYINPEAVSHLLGYRQLADKNDIKNDPCLNKLTLGDKTGKNGIEKLYECALRGVNGKKFIEVDAHGKFVKTLDLISPVEGKELHLSVDMMLQEQAQKLLEGKKGAVVGIKPKTGEVLLLFSNPTFTSQAFEDGDNKAISGYMTSKEKPLYNRATEGLYPPGSTFKLFVATAGLEESAIKKDTKFEDKGVLKAGAQDFHNWYYLEYGRTEGDVDIYKALQRSNDIYFYQLGGKLGPEKIKKWAELFGFQNKSNIGLQEAEGIIPSSFWKQDTFHEQWYLGDTYNLSIGQGYVSASPLQVAMGTAAFANGGYLCKPLLLKVGSERADSPQCKKIPMHEATYMAVREGMKLACETGGTGWPFFDFGIKTKSASSEAKLASGSTAAAESNPETKEATEPTVS
jgi:penicillin-binding protein 2